MRRLAGSLGVRPMALYTYVLDFVRSSALAAHDARATRQDTGMTDDEWWAAPIRPTMPGSSGSSGCSTASAR